MLSETIYKELKNGRFTNEKFYILIFISKYLISDIYQQIPDISDGHFYLFCSLSGDQQDILRFLYEIGTYKMFYYS